MNNQIITAGLTPNIDESSTIVLLFQGRTREVLYEGKSTDINEEILGSIEARLASCRLTGVKVLCASNYVWEEGFKDTLCVMGGEPKIQLRIAELARDKMKVAEDTTEHQTTYSLSRDNEGLDKTTKTTDIDVYDNLDEDSRASSSALLTPDSGEISVCELFSDHEPAPVLPLEDSGEDDSVDSLSLPSAQRTPSPMLYRQNVTFNPRDPGQ
ncbi:hypothetical protein FHETE_8275 [Fusarium heterosporum]|uniref:Uncharacterized protein n=1 Tax=Fusarium heterosporum TaxID=42747 RepID=A0A8H5SZC0_FUSHE|nr:hypothetical protein FHETE_8275 [Fusarium heterosporum]